MMPPLFASLGVLLMVTNVMAGAWTPNRFFYKPEVGARGAQEKVKFDSGLERVDTRLGNEKWLNDPAYGGDLPAALTAIGNNPTILRLPAGTYNIAADLAIPPNITLKPERGAILSIPATKTLTINGPLDAGLYQIFACTGTGKVVFGLGAVDRIFPQWWGAKGDEVTNDTVAIEAAWAACWSTVALPNWPNFRSPTLYFVNGSYVYNGTGLTSQGNFCNISVKGDGPGTTAIKLKTTAPQYYFIDMEYIESLRMSGLSIVDGKGAIRQYGNGANIKGESIVNNCWFIGYTECAIGFNAADKPYAKVRDNYFWGNKASEPIGVALNNASDGSEIISNIFTDNRYHVKTKGAVDIADNDFIRWSDSVAPCWDIWIIPTIVHGVMQTTIRNNKFGQETLDNNDVRILLADEGAGTYNSDKHHSTSTSVGYVDSLKIRDNTFLTTATNHQPIIYSYTPHVYNLNFDNTFYGAYHPSIIGFANALVDDPESGYNRTSNFSYRQAFTGTSFPVPDASSSPGLGHVEDPHGYLEGRLQYPHFYPGAGTDPSYVRLLSRDVITSADWTLYQATKSDATDSVGGANATTVTFTNAGGMFHSFAQDSLLAAGRSGFVEFDVKASATNALTEFEVGLFSTAWTGVCTSRTLKVPNTWTRVRLPFVTRDATALFLRFTPRGYAAGKTSITIGRPAIYYAQEPVNLGAAPQVGLQVLTAVPTNPYAGMIVIADRATWDPKSKGSGGPYPVWYNGSVWKLLNEQ